jgi:hypothetical protein
VAAWVAALALCQQQHATPKQIRRRSVQSRSVHSQVVVYSAAQVVVDRKCHMTLLDYFVLEL